MAHSKHSLCFPASNQGFFLSPPNPAPTVEDYILELHKAHASNPTKGVEN